MSISDSEDEPLALSSHALAALAEFKAEEDARLKEFERLQELAEAKAAKKAPISMAAFMEDWNKSQFWYSDETAGFLARQLLEGADADTTIAIVSAPSVFVALHNILTARDESEVRPKVFLLEYDNRFNVFPEFVFYDFAQPFKLPGELKGAVDRVVVDPPFLSEDCQTKSKLAPQSSRAVNSPAGVSSRKKAPMLIKVFWFPAAMSVRWMMKPDAAEKGRIIISTGERMAELVNKVYKPLGVRTVTYEPTHERGLSNEFWCYANFECKDWTWRETAAS
ncbi:hypothetical protein CFIO01_04048 [Colletotrichum fioriniae PJ7]|uniref:Protein-lysine N-methyltransferase EFM5 n=1 Tax=Colletotrichum fioriniae PJ7 TaxID=1445577 RepID=A0A010RY83_9PEZI|nr:hypothetical protein CFIO01_04048 [Colletotrichum fioriniae PJ7]